MDCYNEYCPWRSNQTTSKWHCDCGYTCPNRDSGERTYATNHTEMTKEDRSVENKT